MAFLSEDGGETYNRCHFWSNFEIGNLNLWRSEAYRAYFDYLDKAGGFFYERWGDAPVHSIAAALFLVRLTCKVGGTVLMTLQPFDQIHYFADVGYRHEPFQHCPQTEDLHKNRCYCNPNDGNEFEKHWYSCTPRFLQEAAKVRRPSVFEAHT